MFFQLAVGDAAVVVKIGDGFNGRAAEAKRDV